MKTYNDIYFAARNALREHGVEAYNLEVRVLVACAAGKTTAEVLRDLSFYTTPAVEKKAKEFTARRIAAEFSLRYVIVHGTQGHGNKSQSDAVIHQDLQKSVVHGQHAQMLQDQQDEARDHRRGHQAAADERDLLSKEVRQQNGAGDQSELDDDAPELVIGSGIIHIISPSIVRGICADSRRFPSGSGSSCLRR